MERYNGWAWEDYDLYKTIRGDTWDDIAVQAYGDGALMSLLIYANPELCRVVVFEGGEIMKIPIISEAASDELPPWKR